MNYSYAFLAREEIKKMFLTKYFFAYVIAVLLDILSFISEYSDRYRSVLYSTGIHVDGQGMAYMISHEFGGFGAFVLYLLPILFVSAPVFSDESELKMLNQIRVTFYGRKIDIFIRSIIVFFLQFIWTFLISFISTILSFTLFDNGVLEIRSNISSLVLCGLNMYIGCFCMSSIFLLISSCLKQIVSSVLVGVALIVVPMFIETESIWIQLFPIVGMQADYMMKRSLFENILVCGFYIFVGIASFVINILGNK